VLEDIRIRGLGVIDDVALELGPGLTVVTGETGAGKTMVVGALRLLFGGRGDAERVRSGQPQATVEGLLRIPAGGALAERVRDAGAELDGDDRSGDQEYSQLTMRRVVSAAGRSRAFVGGAVAPVALLGEIGERTFALHGQADQWRLTQPSAQLRALDQFAGVDVAALRRLFAAWRDADDALRQRTAASRELEREAHLLRQGLAEIEAIDPQPEEDVLLRERIDRLGNADALTAGARLAYAAIAGDADDGSGDSPDARLLLAQARRELEHAGPDRELERLSGRLGEAVADVADIAAELREFIDAVAADPQSLAAAQERLAALRGLIRRYGEDLAAVQDWSLAAAVRLEALDTSEEAIAQLTAARDAAESELVGCALDAAARRRAAAAQLSERITVELGQLAMPDARIVIDVEPRTGGEHAVRAGGTRAPIGPDGLDQVGFRLAPHAGASPGPLQRIASGGELSRVMLAIEVVLSELDPVPIMVFDEVDAGVGGRAATQIGRRLAALARDCQVIVVTHLAQVAVYADTHLVIDKTSGAGEGASGGDGEASGEAGGVTRSDVRAVRGPARRAELARMLSGEDSATARRHAGELLSRAAAELAPLVPSIP
jgi:DNA repair protein RecN (Recombination protein N)